MLDARRPRLPPRGVDAGRLAGLAQGDGVGPARQHGRRDRPGRSRSPGTRAREVAELYPPYPYDEHAPIVAQGAVVDGVLRAGRDGGGHPQAAAAGVHRRPARRARRPAATASTRMPAAARPRRRHRQQQLGRRRRALRDRRAAARQRPAPRRHACPASGSRWACTAATVSDGLPARRRRLHASPACPGVVIGHNADIAWGFTNLGPDVTDLYLERVARRRVAVRRQVAPAARPAPRRSRSPARTTSTLTVRSTRHGPLLSDVSDELADVGANAEAPAPAPRPGRRATRWRSRGPRCEPPPTADAILALDTRHRLGRVPGRRRRLRGARPRTSSTPTARATSATRRPGRIPIRKSGNDGRLPGRRAGARRTTGPATYVPFDALPNVLDPEEGFIVTANQAVDRPRLPLLPHRRLGPRLPLAADPRPARRRGRAVGRRDGRRSSSTTATRSRRCWCRTCSTSTCRAATTAAASELLRDWDFRQAADSGRRGVLQRGVEQPAAS